MLTLDFASDALTLSPGITLVPLHDTMWRVTRPDGDVLGYIESVDSRDGERFRAKRISARLRRFVIIGEFWRMDEAIECFTMG